MKIFATITAEDTPESGFYQARTNFGTTVTGVSLRAEALSVGQQVAVFEVDGEFGAFDDYGNHLSLLAVPSAYQSGIARANPNNTALAYIANKAGLFRNYYKVATVVSVVGDKLNLSGDISGTLPTDGVNAADFTAGDKVLVRVYPSNAVLGWWNTAPTALTGIPAIQIARVKYSASVKMSLVLQRGASYVTQKSVTLTKYPLTEFVDNAYVETLRTTSTEEYFYSYVYMFRAFGAANEEHWVKWHKENFTVEEIDPDPFLAEVYYNQFKAAQPSYTRTFDNKYWWWSYPSPPSGTTNAEFCYTSDDVGTEKFAVFKSGIQETDGAWWPEKNHAYEAL